MDFLSSGIPVRPNFGTLQSGPNAGEVTLQIGTPASGVKSAAQEFAFIITPVLGGVRLESMKYNRSNYISGRLEAIVVSGLMGGQTYTFSATAVNTFGTSEATTSLPITAGMLPHSKYMCYLFVSDN